MSNCKSNLQAKAETRKNLYKTTCKKTGGSKKSRRYTKNAVTKKRQQVAKTLTHLQTHQTAGTSGPRLLVLALWAQLQVFWGPEKTQMNWVTTHLTSVPYHVALESDWRSQTHLEPTSSIKVKQSQQKAAGVGHNWAKPWNCQTADDRNVSAELLKLFNHLTSWIISIIFTSKHSLCCKQNQRRVLCSHIYFWTYQSHLIWEC